MIDPNGLKNLTKKEKLELLDALEKKREIQRSRRGHYAPNAGQTPVHTSDKLIRAVFSGNGAGKTALAVNEAIWAAEGFNPITNKHTPVPARVVVVLDKPEKVDMTWLPELRKWRNFRTEQMQKRGKPYITAIMFDNGSELLFMFHEQDPLTFESIEVSFVVYDEPPPRHIYIALRRGGRRKDQLARHLLIGTPVGGSGWQREEIYEPWSRGELPDTECFRFGTAVNEHNLAEGYISSFSRALTEKERLIRLEGMFHDIDGLGLAHLFSRKQHLVPAGAHRWPPNYPCVVAIDPAMRKPHVALMLGVGKEGQLTVLREFALKAAPARFAQGLKDWMRGYNVVDIVCDSMGSSELTGGDGTLSFIQVLRNEGLRVRATTYDEKDDESWIQMVQSALLIPEEPDNFGRMEPRLKILDNCVGLIHDIETVAWQKHRTEELLKPKLDISKKDFLACLKYALAAQPRFTTGRERVINSGRAGLRRTDRTFRS